MRHLRLWYHKINEHETRKMRAERCPGPEWVELERDTELGETVRVSSGRAEIVAAPEHPAPDPRRAAVVAALPDILLAVADGADLGETVRKAIAKAEAKRG